MTKKSLKGLLRWLLPSIVILVTIWSCENPSGTPYPNTAPDTRLANVPANDTIAQYIRQGVIPEQTLFWVGDDPDGFIVAYRYRWTDFHQTGPETTQRSTILNLTGISGSALDTLIQVYPSAGSVARIYNFFATVDPVNRALIDAIDDSLGTGRYFAVPYSTGPVAGDSVKGVNSIQIEAPNKGIFIFNSPADSNLHRFEVSAIDNNDVEDPTPATVFFWTLRSPGLIVSYLTGPSLTTPSAFVLHCATERNPGLLFTFRAIDPSTSQRDYSWVVDDTVDQSRWSPWSSTASARLTAANFLETGSDTHTIFLRGRNRWGVISATVARQFRASVPAIDNPGWPRRTLLILNDRHTGVGAVDTSLVKAFFLEVLDSLGKRDSVDVWTVTSSNGYTFPSRQIMGSYTNVVLSAEVFISIFNGGLWQIAGDKIGRLQEYLNAGGKLIYSGTPSIQAMIPTYNNWSTTFLHTQPGASPRNNNLDFVGSVGRLGYPLIRLDSTKVPADSLYAIRGISLSYPRGFGETIGFFDSAVNSPFFEGEPLGIRYVAPPAEPGCRQTYSIVHFGFPLYFAKKSDVIQAMRKAFVDINENSIP